MFARFYKIFLIACCLFLSDNVFATIIVTVNTTPCACGNNSGTIIVQASGGVPPYNYLWSNGSNLSSLTGLSTGSYTVSVTDSNGDTGTGVGIINNSNQLQYFSMGISSIGEDATGKISIDIQNGTPPFTVTSNCAGWNPAPFQTNASQIYISGLYGFSPAFTPGTACSASANGLEYEVEVTDANGCTLTTSEVIRTTGFYSSPTSSGSCGNSGTGKIFDTLTFHTGPFDFITTSTLLYVRDNASGQVVDSVFIEVNPPGSTPNSIDFIVDSLSAGDYTLEFHLQDIYSAGITYLSNIYKTEQVTISNLGLNCGTISGTVFYDTNGNCTQDVIDYPLINSLIEIQPGNIFALTDSSGNYSYSLTSGTYTIQHIPQFGVTLTTICPVAQPFGFTISTPQQQVNLNFADSSAGKDLVADVFLTGLRPGFNSLIIVSAINNSATNSYNDTVDVFFDASLQLVTTFPSAINIGSGTARFAIDSLPAFASRQFNLQVTTLNNPILLGTNAWAAARINTLNDIILSNNYDSTARMITSSYDPNQKTVSPTGFGNKNYLPKTVQQLDYLIEFQNTGNDTAFTVVLKDKIGATLDLATFKPVSASHPYSVELHGRELTIRFNNILLADSTTNEIASHGYFAYRISTNNNLSLGTEVKNFASIYFDFNSPILTDTSLLTIYDCDSLFTSLPLSILACENSTIMVGATTFIPLDIIWTLNGQFLGNGAQVNIPNLLAGQHLVVAEALTPYCSMQQSYDVTAALLPLVNITTNGDTLHCDPTGFSYQWYLNNQIIPGATSPDYIAAASGDYTVQIFSFIGCSTIGNSIHVSITGINSVAASSLSIWPNPGTAMLNIQIPKISTNKIDITLYAADGRAVIQQKEISVTGNTVELSTTELANGIYQLELRSGVQQFSTRWIKY